MFMVGLTGGIGAGKSTVAAMLAERGAHIIDADAIARQVVEPGTPALAALVERFGADILRPDGGLDRPALAAKAFVDDESKKALEAITHPAIAEEFFRQIAAAPEGAIVVHDVPLLVESTRGLDYEAVIVVEAPAPVRLDRLESRGVARDDAERRMAAQATDEQRRAVATWVVENAGSVDDLRVAIDTIWTSLLRRQRGGATWEEFATDAPDLAATGRRLLYQSGSGLAFIASLRKDGAPRLHPVCPVIVDDGLYIDVIAGPKQDDLVRDGRYALHAFPPSGTDDEFCVSGRAVERADRHGDVVAALRDAGVQVRDDGRVFELRIDRAMVGEYEARGVFPPAYSVWRV